MTFEWLTLISKYVGSHAFMYISGVVSGWIVAQRTMLNICRPQIELLESRVSYLQTIYDVLQSKYDSLEKEFRDYLKHTGPIK